MSLRKQGFLAFFIILLLSLVLALIHKTSTAAHLQEARGWATRLERDLAQVRVLLEQSGLKDAVQMPRQPLGPSGRGAILVQLAVDARFVRRVTCRLLGREHVLYRGDSPAAQRDIRAIAETIPVPLNAGEFRAVVEVEPFRAYGRDFGMFFGPERTRRERLFLSTPYGVFADPAPGDAARVADLLTIEPAADAGRFAVVGKVHPEGKGRHGWLIVASVTEGALRVVSTIEVDWNSVDEHGDAPWRALCSLDAEDPSERGVHRLLAVFSNDPKALKPGQALNPQFDWNAHGFLKTRSMFKVDGQDQFSRGLVLPR